MSINNKLNKVLETKQAIRQAIIDKGVEVTEDTVFADYPALINSIEVGSGGGEGGDDASFYREFYNMKSNNGTNFQNLFYGYTEETLDISNFRTGNATNMSYMFNQASQLQTIIGIENMDVSSAIDISGMFMSCSSLQSLDLENWETNNVLNINSMFSNCSSLHTLKVNGWDISNIESLDNMFCSCSSLHALDLESWDTNNVTNMYGVFYYCTQLQNIYGIANWDTSKVENMNDMFNNCSSLMRLDISGWDTSNVTSMNTMFGYIQSNSLLKLDLSNFTTKKLQSAYGMFNWCIYLQELDIRNFELVHEDGTMTEISSMLEGCTSLHILRLDNCSNATISKIINESGMPQEPYYDGNTSEYVNREIYCKASEIGDLVAPNGWEFVTVE